MKTTTLTIRLSAADKDLLQTASRGRGLTVTEYLLQLLHADAGHGQTAAGDLRAEMDQLTTDLKELRDQVAALDPQRIGREIKELRRMMEAAEDQVAALAPHTQRERNDKQCERTDKDAAYDPWLDEPPGQTKDCNPSCRWYCEGDCLHPDYQDWENTLIRGDCPKWEPNE